MSNWVTAQRLTEVDSAPPACANPPAARRPPDRPAAGSVLTFIIAIPVGVARALTGGLLGQGQWLALLGSVLLLPGHVDLDVSSSAVPAKPSTRDSWPTSGLGPAQQSSMYRRMSELLNEYLQRIVRRADVADPQYLQRTFVDVRPITTAFEFN